MTVSNRTETMPPNKSHKSTGAKLATIKGISLSSRVLHKQDPGELSAEPIAEDLEQSVESA